MARRQQGMPRCEAVYALGRARSDSILAEYGLIGFRSEAAEKFNRVFVSHSRDEVT